MKKIKLSSGRFALVDDDDYEKCNIFNWQFDGRYAKRIQIRNKILKCYYLHKLILEGKEVDHINGDKLDNRKCNLRLCDRSRNNANKNSQRNSYSKFKGVYKNNCKSKKWRASLGSKGKSIHLGTFFNEVDAALAYNKKALEVYGEFAKLNII